MFALAVHITARIAKFGKKRDKLTFTVDHPCIILIQKKQKLRRMKGKKTSYPLFMGRLSSIKY